MTTFAGSRPDPMSVGEPLVAIVTPVYNGAEYLAECLESVCSQEYQNWIQIVVDNVSTDDTRKIAESFAERDDRIVVKVEQDHVNMIRNWNRAIGYVPEEADYLKQLHADDSLRPRCLKVMVAEAERETSASIVTSTFYGNGSLRPRGAPRTRTLFSGREAAHDEMLGISNLLATPSVPLVRISAAGGWPCLFRAEEFPPGHPGSPPLCQADKEGYLETLMRGNLLFLPEPLMNLRIDEHSAEGFSRRVGAYQPSRLEFLLRHGDRFLEIRELRSAMRRITLRYVRALAWRMTGGGRIRDADFLSYQRRCLDYLLPRLRSAGYTGEAALLSGFASGLRHLGGSNDIERSSCRSASHEPEV